MSSFELKKQLGQVQQTHDRVVEFDSVTDIVAAIAQGEMVIMLDDDNRENEGDLIMAAAAVTAADINFMSRYGRGLICMPVSTQQANRLQLKPMVESNQTEYKTNFAVSIEAAQGVTTGISCADRARTIQVAANNKATAADIISPGHIFPLVAQPGGVLTRPGHTEAAVDLVQLAQAGQAAVLVEILKDDGTMARLPELVHMAKKHNLKIGNIADLIAYQTKQQKNTSVLSELHQSAWSTHSTTHSSTSALSINPNQRIAIVASRFNNLVVDSLISQAQKTLQRCGASAEQIKVLQVPGAYELSLGIKQVLQSKQYAGVVALGAIVKGQTPHFDFIAGACTQSIEQLMLENSTPIGFGVITADTLEQAIDRAGGKAGNKGEEAAMAMVEMLNFSKQLKDG